MNISEEQISKLLKEIQANLYLFFRMSMQTTYSLEPEVGYTLAEIHMLERIKEQRVTTVTELASKTGITKGGISSLVTKLKNKHLVEKRVDPANGSRFFISLTPRGEKVVAMHEEYHNKNNKQFIRYLSQLTIDDFNTLERFTQEMHIWLHSYQNEKSK